MSQGQQLELNGKVRMFTKTKRQDAPATRGMVIVGDFGAKFFSLSTQDRTIYDQSSLMFNEELEQSFAFGIEFVLDRFLFVP